MLTCLPGRVVNDNAGFATYPSSHPSPYRLSLHRAPYAQMGSFFVAQGVKMDRVIRLPGGVTFIIPAASLAMINTLVRQDTSVCSSFGC